MDTNIFNETIVKASRKRQDEIMKTKGPDYCRKVDDRLHNFKTTASDIGISPFLVWAVYAHKHWDAILTYISTGSIESEPIEGRIDDLHNYLYLLEGLIKEKE